MCVPNRLRKIFLLLILGAHGFPIAHACSPDRDLNWVEPSVSQQFEKAGQVVYGVVESLTINGLLTTIKLKNVRTLKGPPPKGDLVETLPGSACGVDLRLGQEYVLFIPKDRTVINRFDQPGKAPSDVLDELRSLGMTP
jgi:hypothetical protein